MVQRPNLTLSKDRVCTLLYDTRSVLEDFQSESDEEALFNTTAEATQQYYQVHRGKSMWQPSMACRFGNSLLLWLGRISFSLVPTPTILSILLHNTSEYVHFGSHASTSSSSSRRIPYVLDTLSVSFEQQPMPSVSMQHRVTLFGVPVEEISSVHMEEEVALTTNVNRNEMYKSCDSILGWGSIVRNGNCREHDWLESTCCKIPPIRFHIDKINWSLGIESIQQVMGRIGEEQRRCFGDGSIEILGDIDEGTAKSFSKEHT